MAASTLALTALFCSAVAVGQEPKPLELNQPLDFDLAREASRPYSIELKAGDYTAGWIDQRSTVMNCELLSPEGSHLRFFRAQPDREINFDWIAEKAGTYHLLLTSPFGSRYRIFLTEKLSLDDQMHRIRLGQTPFPSHDQY